MKGKIKKSMLEGKKEAKKPLWLTNRFSKLISREGMERRNYVKKTVNTPLGKNERERESE